MPYAQVEKGTLTESSEARIKEALAEMTVATQAAVARGEYDPKPSSKLVTQPIERVGARA